ncbi:MAG: hypothetical protein PVG39_20270 [Desulfobacteraceae bacterium]|jgi:hypothetical protein
MGLSPKIHFQYSNHNEIEEVIKEFAKSFHLERKGNLLIISSKDTGGFIVGLAIEEYGLYIHRSGNYLEVFGRLLEEITGKFGKTTIEDY